MQFNRTRLIWIGLFLFLFISGMAGGYIYFLSRGKGPFQDKTIIQVNEHLQNDTSLVRVYYPLKERLLMEERRIKRQTSTSAMAAAIIEEFLKGPSTIGESLIPPGTRLLNTYPGKDGILYIDFSDEIRRNFQGDAYGELLILKGLYESINSNLAGIEDIKILVEGKEIESLGGHLNILYPIKTTVTSTPDQE